MRRWWIAPIVALVVALAVGLPSVASAQGSMEPNVNRPGRDYHSFDIRGGPSACQSACANDRQCAAWTFVRQYVQGPSPRCWLKSAVPPPSGDGCCVSGVMHQGAGQATAPASADPGCCPSNVLVCPAGRHFCASPAADAAASRRQPYNPAWQAAPGDTSCCPNSMLVCPLGRHFCPR